MKLYFHILFTTFVPQPCKKSIGKGKNAVVVEQRFLGFLYRRCTTALRKVHDQREYDSSDRTMWVRLERTKLGSVRCGNRCFRLTFI